MYNDKILNVRLAKNGSQFPWTEEEILAGLSHFYKKHKRYPTAVEIDDYPYLPSARSIQRSYGGLVALRKKLLPNEVSDYTTGEYRKNIARKADARAKAYEEEFYYYLTKYFKEVSIHEHKVIRPGNVNSDFYIYLNDNIGIVIDLFYAQDLRTLLKIVNIMLKRYALVKQDTYLIVVGNINITNVSIRKSLYNRINPLPPNIKVVTENYFKRKILPEQKLISLFLAS